MSLATAMHGPDRENRRMASAGEILTVGHSNHEEGEFLELVRGAGVELIADVRANPRSRYRSSTAQRSRDR